jgi:hypothetical protein
MGEPLRFENGTPIAVGEFLLNRLSPTEVPSMNEVTVSQDDKLLIAALRDNEFDIVGLADFVPDEDSVNRWLRSLYAIVNHQREPDPSDRTLLAHVLLGMVTVARHEYATDGVQEYWPFLFDRIRRAVFADPEQHLSERFSGQKNQRLLGEWFRTALEKFNYSIPSEGNRNLAPLLFHSGIPKTSLAGALRVIAAACETYGPQATSLPDDIRRLLVQNYQSDLQANVKRLLESRLLGANQLWACLSRVVHAWQTGGDCSLELQQLPLALDPDEVREALPIQSSISRAARIELPVLRFDPETGEVRLTIPYGTGSDWSILSGRTAVEVFWTQTHIGWTAEFRRPLPESLTVSHNDCDAGVSRLFETRSELWPGHWFHSHNGNLEDGRVIDANGIQPGRWFVLFQGTPTFCSIPYARQVRLQWNWLAGSTDWTAWEILIPPRTATRTELEWRVGTNSFSVPLARRPSARVEVVSDSVGCATTADGQEVQVFRDAPDVRLRQDKPREMLLLTEGRESLSIVRRLTLLPEQSLQMPVNQPGVYQLRERRGVGRTLLRFALLPEVEVEGPDVDRKSGIGCVCLKSQEEIGAFSTTGGHSIVATKGWYTHEFSTVEPVVELKWRWNSVDAPHLSFRWPIEGVRWRVLGLSEELATWTREPLVISPSRITKNDVEFEVQYPCGAELLVNDKYNSAKTQPGPSGTALRLPLFAYKGAEGIFLNVEGEDYSAILFSDRPLISSLTGLADDKSVLIEWTSQAPLTGCSLVVWDACDVLSEPVLVPLTAEQIAGSYTEVPFSVLPDAEVFAASLLRSVGGMIRKIHHFAASGKDELKPVGLCINRKTGRSHSADEQPQSWDQFLFQASLQRRFGKGNFQGWAVASLKALHTDGAFSLPLALKLCKILQAYINKEGLREGDRFWAQSLNGALLSQIRAGHKDNLFDVFGSNEPALLTDLLDLGIPAGQEFPLKSIGIAATNGYDFAYPFEYLRDLWLVSVCRNQDAFRETERPEFPEAFDELQRKAATRILQFHDEWTLPSPFFFLPLARPTATIQRSSCGHRHEFALPPVSDGRDRGERFQELLGLLDCAIDCDGTSEDQYFQVHRRTEGVSRGRPPQMPHAVRPRIYSLFWASNVSRWQVDRNDHVERRVLRCYTDFQPLVTKEWSAAEMARSFDLHDLLKRWADGHSVPRDENFEFLESLSDKLKDDLVSGKLHREVLRPAQKETMLCFGSPVEVEAVSAVPRVSAICWQMAWIERLSARQGSGQFFGDSEQSSIEFQKALSKSLRLWPKLMRRCLSLAEMLIWTLYGGGIGVAAKFAGPQPIPTYRSLRSTDAAPVNAAIDETKGTIRKDVSGIVVGYEAGIGILLIPRDGVTLQLALRQFITSEHHNLYELVRFNRTTDVTKGDRACLDAEHQARKDKIKPSVVSLSDVFCGRRFLCDLCEAQVWKISSLRLQVQFEQIPIPNDRRKRIE